MKDKSKNYSFDQVFNRLKLKFPNLNFDYTKLKYSEDEEIKLKFNGKEELTSDKVNIIYQVINFLELNHYEIFNPLNISIGFSRLKNDKIDYKIWRKNFDEKPLYKYHDLEEVKDIENFIGEPNLLFVKFMTNFAENDTLDYWKKDIKYLQSRFNSMEEDQILRILNNNISYDYEEKKYWLYVSDNYSSSKVHNGTNFLVSKIEDKYWIIGVAILRLNTTNYTLSEIYIIPKFRKKGYSFIFNKIVQELTDLAYNTKADKTKLGFYQMIRNKRLLKYESFVLLNK